MTIDLASLPNKTSLDGTEQLLLNDGGLLKYARLSIKDSDSYLNSNAK